ncbi:hypothetical protein [Tunturiibacter gelidoferens]|uniref:Uncharacterized protein n=1 Tax=Tunturiibacter lichenicola TaxID=2051959 RepID=A0A7Y9T3U4_9BACT|nr:hypothetical protein [Edaphobacter lichenicola]NYF50729.1 hypothetical protein [Edaphobacter lichenicola]
MAIGAAWGGGWGYHCGWGHTSNVTINHHNTFVNNSYRTNVNRPSQLPAGEATIGSTILNTAAALLTQTGQPQPNMAALPGAIRWPAGRRTQVRTRGSSVADNRQARWIAPAPTGNGRARWIAADLVGNSPAR